MSKHLPKTIERDPNTEYYLVDVDCLYDTRLIILSLIDEEYATKILEDGSYFKRPSDAFEGVIGYEDFKGMYDQRGDSPEILRVAPVTNFHIVLNTLVRQSFSVGRRGGTVTPLGFVINMWPYELEPKEVNNLKGMLFEQLGEACEIHAVWIPPEQLTPTFLSEQYHFMAMYHAPAWMVMHDKDLATRKLKDFFLTCPAVYLDRIPTKEDLEKMQKDSAGCASPFLVTEAAMAPCISIQFLDVELFSILNEHRKLAELTPEERSSLFRASKSLQKVLDDDPLSEDDLEDEEDLDNIGMEVSDGGPTMTMREVRDVIKSGGTNPPDSVPPEDGQDATRQK